MATSQDQTKMATDESSQPRKKLKTSDLPLSTAKRSAIDSLLHTFKKKGEFDALRKQIWAQFTESAARLNFTTALTELAESELDRDPQLLAKDRGKAATLIEGAVDRTDIYKTVELDLDALIGPNVEHVLSKIREIRQSDVGIERAEEEQRIGSKTDADYEAEAEYRRRKRAEIREQQLREEKAKEREAHRIQEEERRKQREQQEEARQIAREEAKRAELEERARQAERQREEHRERERRYQREYERDARDYREHHSPATDRYSHHKWQDSSRASPARSPAPIKVEVKEEKDLDEVALEMLLKEGQELAAKTRQKPELERSESLEPPPRRGILSRSSPRESSLRPQAGGDTPKASRAEEATSSDRSNQQSYHESAAVDRTGRARSGSPHGSHRDSTKYQQDRHSRDRSYDRRPYERKESSLRYSSYRSSRDYRDHRDYHDHRDVRDHKDYRDRRDSRPPRDEQDEEERKAEKEAWKRAQVALREKEAAAYKRAQKEGSQQGGSPHSKIIMPSTKPAGKDTDYDSSKKYSHWHRSSRSPPPSRHRDYSRSPPRRRERSRSKTPPRRTYRERSRSRSRRSRERSSGRRRNSGSRSPVEIDKYRPSGSSRAYERKTYSDRRDRSVDSRRDERPRHVDIDRYVPGGHSREAADDRRRGRETTRSRRRDYSRSASRGRSRDVEKSSRRPN